MSLAEQIDGVSRPHMPGYGLLPADEGTGLLPWSHVEGRMRAARNYWVVTASDQGVPHAAPVWGVWHPTGFYFGTGARSRKARNLQQNNWLVVHSESGDEVVILEGRSIAVEDESLIDELDNAYQKKYGVELKGNPVIGMRLSRALAWSEANFPGSATRWSFRQQQEEEAS